MNQKHKILKALIFFYPQGVTNRWLNDNICYRYSARLWDLGRDGFDIKTEKVKGSLFKFTLLTLPEWIDSRTLKPIVQEELFNKEQMA